MAAAAEALKTGAFRCKNDAFVQPAKSVSGAGFSSDVVDSAGDCSDVRISLSGF
jgi:hypothetical protein